jgi:hypothetical protein
LSQQGTLCDELQGADTAAHTCTAGGCLAGARPPPGGAAAPRLLGRNGAAGGARHFNGSGHRLQGGVHSQHRASAVKLHGGGGCCPARTTLGAPPQQHSTHHKVGDDDEDDTNNRLGRIDTANAADDRLAAAHESHDSGPGATHGAPHQPPPPPPPPPHCRQDAHTSPPPPPPPEIVIAPPGGLVSSHASQPMIAGTSHRLAPCCRVGPTAPGLLLLQQEALPAVSTRCWQVVMECQWALCHPRWLLAAALCLPACLLRLALGLSPPLPARRRRAAQDAAPRPHPTHPPQQATSSLRPPRRSSRCCGAIRAP